MRIFCAVRHSNDPMRFYGGLWSGNFYPALRALGHEIIESQTDLAPASAFMEVADHFTRDQLQIRAGITQKIIDEIHNVHSQSPIDLFLGYFYNSHFDPSGFAEIRALGIPAINYYCNSMYQFQLVASIAAAVDFSWHAEKAARGRYLAVGAKPVWVQMGADPSVYAPIDGMKREGDACFVGQRYADRERWMAALIRARVPVALYGPGWGERPKGGSPPSGSTTAADLFGKSSRIASEILKNIRKEGLLGGFKRSRAQQIHRREIAGLMPLFRPIAQGGIAFEQIRKVFAAHEVILNFSNVWADGRPGSSLIPHVRLRDFEAPMCRTCYLSGHTDELAEFYEIGKEIDTYRSYEELVDKARYYLRQPAAAESLRERGYQRAIRDHTWVHRFEELFRKTGINQ